MKWNPKLHFNAKKGKTIDWCSRKRLTTQHGTIRGSICSARSARSSKAQPVTPRSRMPHAKIPLPSPPPCFNALSTLEITSFVGFFCSLRGPVCHNSIHLSTPPPFRCVEVAAIPWCRSLRGLAGNTVMDPRSGASWLSLCVTVLSHYVESL